MELDRTDFCHGDRALELREDEIETVMGLICRTSPGTLGLSRIVGFARIVSSSCTKLRCRARLRIRNGIRTEPAEVPQMSKDVCS